MERIAASAQNAHAVCVDKTETEEGREIATMLSKCNIAQLPADARGFVQIALQAHDRNHHYLY